MRATVQQLHRPINYYEDIESFKLSDYDDPERYPGFSKEFKELKNAKACKDIEEQKRIISNLTLNILIEYAWPKCEAHDTKEYTARLADTLKQSGFSNILDAAKHSTSSLCKDLVKKNLERISEDKQQLVVPEEFQDNFKKFKHLSETRQMFYSQFANFYAAGALDKQVKKSESATRDSIMILTGGLFLENHGAKYGICGEFAQLTLIKILKQTYEDYGHTRFSIEYVSANLGDGCDGHCLLLVNRKEGSDITDFTTWGDDCILIDSWGKVCIPIADYELSNKKLLFMHSIVDATVFKFDYLKASCLVENLSKANDCYTMTGLSDIKDRKPRIMDEYELTSLEPATFPCLNNVLAAALDKAKSANFKFNIQIFITLAGKRPVTYLPGLNVPKIAIHKDFLEDILNGNSTLQQLEYALHREIQFILHNTPEEGLALEIGAHSILDQKSIESGFANIAIDYLRYAIKFAEQHKNEINICVPLTKEQVNSDDLYLDRIKNIKTYLVKDKTKQKPVDEQGFPAHLKKFVTQELARISHTNYYKGDFDSISSIDSKLNFLLSKVKQLTLEVYPFELTGQPSRRVREYCELIRSIDIDWEDKAQVAILDNIVNALFEHRVSAFEYVYKTISKKYTKAYEKDVFLIEVENLDHVFMWYSDGSKNNYITPLYRIYTYLNSKTTEPKPIIIKGKNTSRTKTKLTDTVEYWLCGQGKNAYLTQLDANVRQKEELHFTKIDFPELIQTQIHKLQPTTVPEVIYKEIQKKQAHILSFPQLSKFRELQNYINNFINAKSATKASKWAELFLELNKELDSFFGSMCSGAGRMHKLHYDRQHKAVSSSAAPVGKDRFFGANIGKRIGLQGFAMDPQQKLNSYKATLQWEEHILWAKQDQQIAITLWHN